MKTLLLILALLQQAVPLPGQKYIDYEMYGAVGDGVTDDSNSIAAAHKAANRLGLPVRVNPEKTYYIGAGRKEIKIRTSTDFGKSHFIIDDRDAFEVRKKAVFVVESCSKPLKLVCTPLKRTDRRLGCGRLPGDCLVKIVNGEKKIYIRKGLNRNDGTTQTECLLVNRKGKILSSINWDYDKITSATAYPVDKDVLTIHGGIFTTIANQAESKYSYYSRGFRISRSNVTIDSLVHYVEGEADHGAPYAGFISIANCSGTIVRNCLLTAHKTYRTTGRAGEIVSMGSYDLNISGSINTTISSCQQTTEIDDREYWGLMASNFCKGITVDNCVLSRFDAHQGVMNVTLRNSTFGYMGTRAVGSGNFRIENCEIRANCLFSLREDYGSTWDGDIFIGNCTLKPLRGNSVRIIGGSNDGTHNFGYPCTLPRRIVIEGLMIDDSRINSPDYNGPVVFSDFTQADGAAFPIAREGSIKIRNLTVRSGKQLKIGKDPENFKGYKMTTPDRDN